MPTTTVNATYQGLVQYSTNFYLDWVFDVRNASVGNVANTYTTNTSVYGIRAYESSSRGGTTGVCARTFLFFDLSSVPGVITSATLSVLGWVTGDLNTITVKGNAWGGGGGTSTLSTSDYDELEYSTPYSSELYGWTTTGYNDFTLNSTAISDMNSNGYLNVVVIDFDYDYNAVSPGILGIQQNGVEFLDSTYPIKLTLTYVPDFEVLGISPLLISAVNGVSFSDIEKVIGAPPT